MAAAPKISNGLPEAALASVGRDLGEALRGVLPAGHGFLLVIRAPDGRTSIVTDWSRAELNGVLVELLRELKGS